jgi:hypothetical protein
MSEDSIKIINIGWGAGIEHTSKTLIFLPEPTVYLIVLPVSVA